MPGLVYGEITSAGTRPPPPLVVVPSSQSRNKAALLNAGDARIGGSCLDNHVSPVWIEQWCMSWHMSGVIQTNDGSRPALRSVVNVVNGTTWFRHRVASFTTSS